MRRFIRDSARYAASLVLLAILWETAVQAFRAAPYVLPSPWIVARTLGIDHQLYKHHLGATLVHMSGAVIGILAGLAVGFGVAYSRTLRWIAEPYLIIFQSFPRESLIPLIVVWFGFGATPKVINAALLSFFPIAVITLNSLLDTRTEYLELVRNWGASRWQEYVHCRLPYAVQPIAGGLKVALPLGLIGAVIGEFMGGNEGLGYLIVSSGANLRLDRSFGAVVILAGIGVLLLAFVRVLQDVILRRFRQE